MEKTRPHARIRSTATRLRSCAAIDEYEADHLQSPSFVEPGEEQDHDDGLAFHHSAPLRNEPSRNRPLRPKSCANIVATNGSRTQTQRRSQEQRNQAQDIEHTHKMQIATRSISNAPLMALNRIQNCWVGSDPLRIAADHCLNSRESFFLADLGRVAKQFELWMKHLPAVRPFYAVKCNPDPNLLRLLTQLGSGFDCASIAELQLALSVGAQPKDIIFANPCKAPSALAFAAREGLTTTTFDNHSELEKIKILMPNARLLLRIYANDPTALVPLGDKFGATRCSVAPLLQSAHASGLNVVGISFHVGSGASDLDSLRTAIESARHAWDLAEALNMPMEILDIGGGFQHSSKAFISMAIAAKEAIAKAHFPAHAKLIAEPGRFFARNAYTLFTQVIALREHDKHEHSCCTSCSWQHMLYQNDGVYKSFMNRIIEKEEFHPILVSILRANNVPEHTTHIYSVWGPTCDSTDLISRRVEFPYRIQVGDWLMYENMGAYTLSTATNFNGFSGKSQILYVNNVAWGHELGTPT